MLHLELSEQNKAEGPINHVVTEAVRKQGYIIITCSDAYNWTASHFLRISNSRASGHIQLCVKI